MPLPVLGAASTPPRLLLASGSPRRRLLLALFGLQFRITPTEADENPLSGESPLATARRLAIAKARSAKADPGEPVIAADTVVIVDGVLFGKPGDVNTARAMLLALRDRWHDVVTAVALRPAGASQPLLAHRQSRVHIRPFSDTDLESSIARGTPFDKAGGYAIQDEVFRPVDGMRGCYPNVVGLPLCEVERLLHHGGLRSERVKTRRAPCELCRASTRIEGLGGGWLLNESRPEPRRG